MNEINGYCIKSSSMDGASHIKCDDWEILDGERIRRWPDNPLGGKRGITICIQSWVGVSIGAKHFYVEVDEEENQFWSESQNAWITIDSDSERSGYSMRAECLNVEEAEKIAKYFVKIITKGSKDSHIVKWDNIL